MKWQKIRTDYPNKWIIYDILEESEKNNYIIVTDIAILEIFDTLDEAYKYYIKLHKKDKTRKVTIGDTRKEELVYKIERVGLLR